MHLRPAAAAGVLLSTCWLVVGAAGPAAAVCDSYSGVCVDDDLDGDDGGPADRDTDTRTDGSDDGAAGDNRVLPFTGGELVLLTGLGAGALAGGTALVLAGRRKSNPSL